MLHCGKLGHLVRDCRSGGKAKDKSDGKGFRGKTCMGKGDDKWNTKNRRELKCYHSGKLGHLARDAVAANHALNAANQDTDRRIAEKCTPWSMMMKLNGVLQLRRSTWKRLHAGANVLELAVERGTEMNDIPYRLMTKLMKWIQGPAMIMRGASGE